MTGKTENVFNLPVDAEGSYCDVPERSAGHFCSAIDPGIVVDVEIQAGDPEDSQFIRLMGEFEAASKTKSV